MGYIVAANDTVGLADLEWFEALSVARAHSFAGALRLHLDPGTSRDLGAEEARQLARALQLAIESHAFDGRVLTDTAHLDRATAWRLVSLLNSGADVMVVRTAPPRAAVHAQAS